jgi:putative oxidoreductase
MDKMNLEAIRRLGTEFDERCDYGYGLLRVYLGVGLCVRGAMFISHPEYLTQFVRTGDWLVPAMLMHYVGIAHVIGGIMLCLGLYTRLASAVQLPIMFVAVFFVHLGEGLMSPGQSFELSGLVFFMLAVFSVFGSGRLSLDYYLKRRAAKPVSGPPLVPGSPTGQQPSSLGAH